MDSNYLKWPAGGNEAITVSFFNEDSPVDTHKHDFIEVVFLAEGTCLHIYHGIEVTLIPGDVFIITPHEEHSYSINSKVAIYNCLFYPEVLGNDWDMLKEMKGVYDMLMVEPFYRSELGHQEIIHLQPSEAVKVESIMNRLIDEQDAKDTGFNLMQKANLVILLSMLGRAWENQLKNNYKVYSSKREMLTMAINHIENNYSNQFKIDELASSSYFSPHYFRKIFREVTGLTPVEYINKLRISKSVQLLRESSMSISEIAEAVGISEINYFSRLFRSLTGCSPSEFRKKNDLY